MDQVLVDGDQAIFQPSFGLATVIVRAGRLTGSGPMQAAGKSVCVDGDEGSVLVAGCNYVTPLCTIPGSGTLEVASLSGDQKATSTQSGGKKVLLVGGRFTARFKVQTPAQQPPPGAGSPTPDAAPQYSGAGSFVTTNFKLRAT